MQLYNGIKVFSQDEMYQVHQSAMHILQEVGLEMDLSNQALHRLASHGLKVDFETKRVRFPLEPVYETIRQLSGATTPDITVTGTAKATAALRIPQRLRALVGSEHGFVYDVWQERMRAATCQDMIDLLKVKRHLADVDITYSGICPQDVPAEVVAVHEAAFNVTYCKDPSAPEVNGLDDLVWVERVMQASGAWESDRHRAVGIYPISPLRMAGRGAALMEFQAGRGDLTTVIGMVIPGASSPITLASHTVIVLAEELGFNTAYRLLVDPPHNTFHPRSIGDDVCIMDMRRGVYVLSSPEVSLLRLATHQMAGEFYKLPGYSDGGIRMFPDAQQPGAQAASEAALMAMAGLCQGIYSDDPDVECIVGILGSLSGNLSICLEQALVDHEMFQYLQRFAKGVTVTPETLALDEIARVGPGGNFMDSEHTARHLRQEMWFPKLSHRGAWAAWEDSGRRSSLDLAKERVKAYLKDELIPVLDEDHQREVNRVVVQAEIALLGKTTGLLPGQYKQ
jgi:trimethylamine---corrinoid protein Co-methyltransferase